VVRVNSGTYPGLFYRVMRFFVVDSVPTSVVVMRLVNTALAAVLLGAALALSRPRVRRALALSWMVTLVPLGMFIIPSTNPSSWTVSGLGTYWAFLVRLLDSSVSARTRWLSAGFCTLSGVVAIGSRSDGAAYLCLVTIAVVLAVGDLGKIRPFQLVVPLLLAVAAVYVYLTAGQSTALGGFATPEELPGRSGLTLLLTNVANYPGLLLGVFGVGWGLGWLDTYLPHAVGALATAAAFGALLMAAKDVWVGKMLAVGLIAAALVVLPLKVLQGGGNVVGENVQPRYLLPLVMSLVALATLSKSPPTAAWRSSRGAMALTVVVLTVANVLALGANLRRYLTGVDDNRINLDRDREWWWAVPVTPDMVWVGASILGLLLFAGLAWTVLASNDAGGSGRRLPTGP
jgi:hypothetical protein